MSAVEATVSHDVKQEELSEDESQHLAAANDAAPCKRRKKGEL